MEEQLAEVLATVTPVAQRVAARMLWDLHLRQDAVQETQIAAYRMVVVGPPFPDRLSSWAVTVAVRKCIDVVRRQGSANIVPMADLPEGGPPPGGSPHEHDPTRDLQDEELLERLRVALHHERRFRVLKLWICEDRNGREIAEVLGISEATVSRDKGQIIQRFLELHPEHRQED
ncbi:RNA polymerase sigma factor [Streptomyces sp. NRRL B-3648]|uniref:RNA polymerase sigma factor n=1 Tax=Streptomyces sp. NRRL B-3648 TaxID=1519493 RepID=UPI0006B02325|nr:sigma-70 family RNA polymerase sigma factor [Streptomyces sp. NRRL B-3648]KOX03451.1 hypothetical protein ADL04_09680 [Streptomyces sp. NRRL B-3648]